jgi:DNA-binding MarR family transcriptional regulator
MSKPSSRSTLYRLIEAGQLARKALLVPVVERGLEPGDDAVLFVLGRSGISEAELASELAQTDGQLETRIARLLERDLVRRQAVGPELTPGLALTERGLRIRNALAEHWNELEEALLGDMKKRKRQALGDALQRFIDLLRF